MKIVVLVKQVPRPDSIVFNEETKSLKREGVPLELNPFDVAAVKHAVRLRDAAGGEVVAMTMGPPQAEASLRLCLQLGADRCIHLSDRVFAVADTIGTSRTLALALRKEGADLVLAGRKTVDSETWQVPPETAAYLGWAHLTSVVSVDARNGVLHATRETDEGVETYELELPALLSLTHADGETTGAGADGRIDVWTAADLVDDLDPEYDDRFGQPGSPTRVLAVRDVTPPRGGVRAGSAEEAARLIGTLLGERGAGETSWDKPPRLGDEPGESYDCWTLVELYGSRPARTSLELLAKGRELAGKLGGENVALLLGFGLDAAAARASCYGADRIVVVEDERLEDYHPDLYAAALAEVLRRRKPHVLLIPSTANGRDFGPRAAGELELGMTGDCVGLGIDRAGRLIQTKPAYGGNIVSVIMGATTPQLATVRARMFDLLEPRDDRAPVIERLELDALPHPRLRPVDRQLDERSAAYKLDEADVVVLAGPGADDVAELERQAAALDAAVGGTREVCAADLLPRNRQVGLFGRPVAPRLLVAVGVPGDFEHLAGFVKAGVVAAIDSDASTPMLGAADVALVGDWRELVPQLAAAVRPHV